MSGADATVPRRADRCEAAGAADVAATPVLP
jgi:hypothetical protein